MACCCTRVSNRTDAETPQHQPQKGTWLAYGVKSVCTLTGATLGAVVGGYGTLILAAKLALGALNEGNEPVFHMIELSMPLGMVGGALQGATVGAVAGCCVANRIMSKLGHHHNQLRDRVQ